MYGYLKEHVGAFGPHEIRTLVAALDKAWSPFRLAESTLTRVRTLSPRGRFLRSTLLRPLCKASVISAGSATALS
jgi:hypothetical protein